MAALNAFKVAEWIGQHAGRGPEVKVERTKEANILVTCSTFGARRLAPQKWFAEVEVEIVMGLPREENECKGVHGGEVDLNDEELVEGLKAAGVEGVRVQRLRARGVPMETVVVTFRGKQVPESVTFGYMRFRVKVYVPRPIRCWRCQMFGHVEARCQAAIRCPTRFKIQDSKFKMLYCSIYHYDT